MFKEPDERTTTLRSVDVPIVNINKCRKEYQAVGNRKVTRKNICAGKQGKQHCSVRFRKHKYK